MAWLGKEEDLGANRIFPEILVQRVLTYIFDRWYSRVVMDKKLMQDLVDFYNSKMGYVNLPLSTEDGWHLAKLAARLNGDVWHLLKPETEAEIDRFYQSVPWYPFELAYWHMNGFQRSLRRIIASKCFGHVLDYGGGIGDLSLLLARKGLKVTYADVQGMNFEFARWLFARAGLPIDVVNLSDSYELPDRYNVILCIDVVGQVTRPEELLRTLANHLADNGRLIVTQLKSPGNKEINPSHLRIKCDYNGLFQSLSLKKISNYNTDLIILEKIPSG